MVMKMFRAPLAKSLMALGLLVAATAACGRAKSAEKAPPPSPPVVVVAEVVQRTVPIVRDFTARTEAVPTVEVRARIAGVLERVMFEEGTQVKAGQTLFIIQPDEYAAALESARAQLAKAEADVTRARDISIIDRARAQLDQRSADLDKTRRDVARYEPLAEARAIPRQDLDTAQASERVAAAGVEGAEAALKDTKLAQRTDPDRRRRSAVGQSLRDPGGAEPRLHDREGPHHRDHRESPGRPRESGGQVRAHAARDDLLGGPHLRRRRCRRSRLSPACPAHPPRRAWPSPGGDGAARAVPGE